MTNNANVKKSTLLAVTFRQQVDDEISFHESDDNTNDKAKDLLFMRGEKASEFFYICGILSLAAETLSKKDLLRYRRLAALEYKREFARVNDGLPVGVPEVPPPPPRSQFLAQFFRLLDAPYYSGSSGIWSGDEAAATRDSTTEFGPGLSIGLTTAGKNSNGVGDLAKA